MQVKGVTLLEISWHMGYPDGEYKYLVNAGEVSLDTMTEAEAVALMIEKAEEVGLSDLTLTYSYSNKEGSFEGYKKNEMYSRKLNVYIKGREALQVGGKYFELTEIDSNVVD